MENASKALVIAGAILISILLISLGIVLVNSGKSITGTGEDMLASQSIQVFNSQFTSYEGQKNGAELKELIRLVEASNVTNPNHEILLFFRETRDVTDISNTNKYDIKFEKYTGNNKVGTNYKGSTRICGPDKPENHKTEIGYLAFIAVTVSD